jgi:hypothetical protein
MNRTHLNISHYYYYVHCSTLFSACMSMSMFIASSTATSAASCSAHSSARCPTTPQKWQLV